MNKRPGAVRVTTEVAYCTFCGRPRTLRREERQLGALVRSVVTCETCHRTLSSTVGVAETEPVAAEPVAADVAAAVAEPPAAAEPKPARRSATKPAPKAKTKPKAPATKKVPPKPRGKGSK